MADNSDAGGQGGDHQEHFVEELEERENTVPFVLTTMALGEETDGGIFELLRGF